MAGPLLERLNMALDHPDDIIVTNPVGSVAKAQQDLKDTIATLKALRDDQHTAYRAHIKGAGWVVALKRKPDPFDAS